jgi:hypothetical protein
VCADCTIGGSVVQSTRVPLKSVASLWTSDRRNAYLIRPEVVCPLSVDVLVWPDVESVYDDLFRAAIDPHRWTEYCRERSASPPVQVWTKHVFESGEHMGWPNLNQLGYDVMGGGVSGLSNCRLPQGSNILQVDKWKNRINDNHLFVDAGEAREFCKIMNAINSEHAPFEVYAIGMF